MLTKPQEIIVLYCHFLNIDARFSFLETNYSISASTSTKSRTSRWIWPTTREIRRCWVIVLRSQLSAYEERCINCVQLQQARREANGPASRLHSTHRVAPATYFSGYQLHHSRTWLNVVSEKAQAEFANLAMQSISSYTDRSTAKFPHFSVNSIFSNTWYLLRRLGLPWMLSWKFMHAV
jgi:hypothetical protein